jgi:antitoxin component YwqK of YwqJK toxin-antitoxin module
MVEGRFLFRKFHLRFHPMKSCFLFFFLIIFFNASAQDTLNYVDANGMRQGRWIITGAMKKDLAYKPEAKVEEGNYTDSKKTGPWIEYYPNGNKKDDITFVNNRPNGPAITYYENGNKKDSGCWKGSRWIGEYKHYYENDSLQQLFYYDSLGHREGKQFYYFPNGRLNIERECHQGKENGWTREYDSNGKLLMETFYNSGVIDLLKTHDYRPHRPNAPQESGYGGMGGEINPMPPKPCPPFNGEGQYTLYQYGQVYMKGTFHRYRLVDGERRVYDKDGILIQVKLYKDGKYIGDGPLPQK